MKILYSLNTPCLVVDYRLLLKNIKTMASFVKKSGVNIRPHFKTHKCVEIAKLQIKYGAIGITCATIDEAEALAKGGIKSILIANQLTDEHKIKRLLKLQKNNNQVIVGVEDETNLALLNDLAGRQKKKIKVVGFEGWGGKKKKKKKFFLWNKSGCGGGWKGGGGFFFFFCRFYPK